MFHLIIVAICQKAPHDCAKLPIQQVMTYNSLKECQTEADARNGISTLGNGAVHDAVGRTSYAYCAESAGCTITTQNQSGGVVACDVPEVHQ